MGFNHTKERKVDGMICEGFKIRWQKVTFRITSDKMGKTISLADDTNGVMIAIPVEPVADLIKWGCGDADKG